MPILTFWGVTPSGASARAVLPLPKGRFRVVQGSKMACGKVIHKMWKTGIRDSGFGHTPWVGPRFHKPRPGRAGRLAGRSGQLGPGAALARPAFSGMMARLF